MKKGSRRPLRSPVAGNTKRAGPGGNPMRAIFALAVIGMLAAMPARADVTYDFVVTSATPGYSNFPGAVLSAGSVVGRLSIPDNIVAQGTLTATPCNVYVDR